MTTSGEVEFRALRDALEVSDSLLSQHVSALEQAGYIDVHKGFVGKRARTWIRSTRSGQDAFRKHYDALQDIANTNITPSQ